MAKAQARVTERILCALPYSWVGTLGRELCCWSGPKPRALFPFDLENTPLVHPSGLQCEAAAPVTL